MVLLLTAFRTAWPAFAYSIERDDEAKGAYGFVLTYLVVISSWVAATLGSSHRGSCDRLTRPDSASASRVVGPLAFRLSPSPATSSSRSVSDGRAVRSSTGSSRDRGGGVNVALCLGLIPPYGMMGAAVATVASYAIMFVGMAWWSQHVYPVPYQWRRV